MKKVINPLFIIFTIALILFITFFTHFGFDVEELREEFTYPESKFVNIDGLDVHYRITGDEGLPVVILMHGVASSLHTWEGWHNELSKEFRVISFDVPGFGLTGPFPDKTYNLEKYMQFMDQLFKGLNIDNAILSGNSFGGYLSFNYALHNPKFVNKLLLIDAAGLADEVTETSWSINIGFELSIAPIIKYFSWYVTPNFILKESVKNVYGDNSLITDELVDRYYSMMLRKGNREAFSSILIYSRSDASNLEKIAMISQPTLVMWGEQDTLHSMKEAELFLQVPNSKLISYPELGHVPMEENPSVTVRDAKAFFLE